MCDKEKLFLELIDGFKWKHDKENFERFLFAVKDDVYLLEIYNFFSFDKKKFIVNYRLQIKQDLTDFYVYVHNDMIWKLFESKFNMNYDEIKLFMANMFEKYFKIINSVPVCNKVF